MPKRGVYDCLCVCARARMCVSACVDQEAELPRKPFAFPEATKWVLLIFITPKPYTTEPL